MADIVAPEVRSRMMSGIRGKNTRPEMRLRKALHIRGIRYRLNDRRLPGSPDLVFPGRKAVIFVHGCYWHRHAGCPKATTPSSNVKFWRAKFDTNVRRDARNLADLRSVGWRPGVVWECAIARQPSAELLDAVMSFLDGGDLHFEIGAEDLRGEAGSAPRS